MNEPFPAWLRIHHYVNFLFITLLIRSGIQILTEHPRLYFNDHCTPGSEWLKFTRKSVPTDRLYTSHDDVIATPHWLGLPGGPHRWFGMALDWHFLSVIFWIGNGLIYVGLLFLTGQWHRLILTSWSIFPDAVATLRDYLSFRMPPEGGLYYDTLDLPHAKHPQTLLAYEMNGHPLPLAHGAPLRLRIETKLGFKMVKWIKTIEFVEDFRHLGEGRGGYDEDKVNFGWYAEI